MLYWFTKDKQKQKMYYHREWCCVAIVCLLLMAELPLNNGCESFSEPRDARKEQSYNLFGRVTTELSRIIELGLNNILPVIVATIDMLKIVYSTHEDKITEEIVKNNVVKQKAVLESMNTNLEYLKQLDNNPSSAEHWINIMRNNMQTLIFDLDDPDSVSKRYPHDFIPILAGLASVIPIHTHLERLHINESNQFFLPCETLRTLNNYKQLAHYQQTHLIEWRSPFPISDECIVIDSSGFLALDYRLFCCGDYSDRLRSFVYDHFNPIVNVVEKVCNKNIILSTGTLRYL